MPYSITTKDGITINNIPDNIAPDAQELKDRVAALRAGGGQTRSVGEEASRQLGLTARAGAEGVAGTLGILSDPIGAVLNQFISSEDKKFVPLRNAVSDLLTRAGVPTPETSTERVVNAGASSVAGVLPNVGVANVLAKAANPLAQTVGQKLGADIAGQVGGAGAGGVASQTVAENGGGGGAQFLAGLAGGVAGGSAASRAARPSAPAVAPRNVPGMADAEKLNIPVLTSDVLPPSTFGGKVAQAAGERVPFAGTAGVRQSQQEARQSAISNVVGQYVTGLGDDAARVIADDVLKKNAAQVTKYAGMKEQVLQKVGGIEVPVARTTQAIDEQIAQLQATRLQSQLPAIAVLDDFKQAIQNQDIGTLEQIRKRLGDQLADPNNAGIRAPLEKASSVVYGALKQDFGEFIANQSGPSDALRWSRANKALSELIGEASNSKLKNLLNKGEATPELVNSMLFSKNASDAERLARRLSPQGRANAQSAILENIVAKAGGLENVSTAKFVTALNDARAPVSAFFKGSDAAQLEGLVKALRLTERAAAASVAPATGVQNFQLAGATLLGSFLGGPGSIAAAGAVGAGARAYESKAVRNLLMKLGNTKNGSQSEAALLAKLQAAIIANQNTQEPTP